MDDIQFRARIDIDVPLWLAIDLKLAKKCRITIPRWMDEDALRALYNEENNDSRFAEIPFYAFEIAKILTRFAGDDFSRCDKSGLRIRSE